jgi:Mu-like prophage FluMu protein gp28
LSATPETIAQLTNKSDSLFIGMDIGRKKDLSVIWVGQDVAGFIITLGVWVMERTPFHIQKSLLFSLLNLPQVRRVCIDETGIGIQIAEEARFAFGSKVEPVWFTGRAKEEIAFQLLRKFEDRHIAIPANDDIRNDLHSIQKITTAAGNIRFDQAARNNVVGHADRFWALGLMVHAACSTPAAFFPITGKKESQNNF